MQIVASQRYVVVGFDGSPNSIAALRRGAEQAQRRHARLDVIQVLPQRRGGPVGVVDSGSHWLRLRSQVARLLPTTQHLTTRLRIAYGDPATALINASRHAELLIVGAREHSEHGNPLGGPTVPAVLSGAACEVVVCADQKSTSTVDH